ncbi:ATP-binding protein [uncultured Limosilactobacillus sp.]|uniref:ATP-binding protein n=1 Tax=uncultured Limosilactobacillus sp. TaxID=2837629 RepID=UPI00265EBC84|nr:ATP-binding protein [uncultured Limosilactobacillus sp.]
MSNEQEIFSFNDKVSREKQQQMVARILARHLLIVGQTGSGKTTTTLSLLNYLQHRNQTTIVLDPTGEYAQLPNAITYKLGVNAYLEAGSLSANELQEVLQLTSSQDFQDKLNQAITALRIQHNLVEKDKAYIKCGQKIQNYQHYLEQLGNWAVDYDLSQLVNQLIEEFIIPFADDRADYHLLGQQYDRLAINHNWGMLTTLRERIDSEMFKTVFDTVSHPGSFKTELSFILKMFLTQRSTHRTLVIDLSLLKRYEDSQRALISFLMKKILNMRFQAPQQLPVNIVIDEAHRYLPQDQKKLPDNGIFQALREGRKLHLKVTLTTQSPLDLPAKLRSQFSNGIIHCLIDDNEIKSLEMNDLGVKGLNVGEAYLKVSDQTAPVTVTKPNWW